MKPFLLSAKSIEDPENDPWDSYYDCTFGFVIRAESETEARKMASEKSGCESIEIMDTDENYINPWLSPNFSNCVELESKGEPKIIIQDHRAG